MRSTTDEIVQTLHFTNHKSKYQQEPWACLLACGLVAQHECSSTSSSKARLPGEPSTSSKAASAWAAPAIMLGTKSRCPGASRSVTLRWLVWKRVVATSTVTPLARSSGLSSSSQAQEKDALPACAASFSCLCTAFCDTYLQVSHGSRCCQTSVHKCQSVVRMFVQAFDSLEV